jgi:DNA-binding Lrp family transcriptional regulator
MPKKSTLIDERDRKILVELDRNARQTDSAIAKKLKISKQVVNYRIQQLINKKIITNFYTIVNVGIMGLNSYYVFLQFEKINKEQERKLLEKINSLSYVGWLVSGMGRWDAIICLNVESILDFEKSLNQIIDLCGKHMHEYIFTTLIEAEHLNYKFLGSKLEGHLIKQTVGINKSKIDKLDEKILAIISQNARLPITDISEKAKLPLHVVSYHLKNLVKSKIVEGFKPKLDINKMGYQWHLLLIQFQTTTEERKKQFIDFCRNHNKIYYITKTIGSYNLMLDLHVNDVGEFKDLLLELKDKFSDVIRLYESMTIFNEYKISYLSKN